MCKLKSFKLNHRT
jgi:hypothetical protein